MAHLRQSLDRLLARPVMLVELFVLANTAFLAVDIFIAHSLNAFAHWGEWIPIVFSALAPCAILLAMALAGLEPPLEDKPAENGHRLYHRFARRLGLAVGWTSLGVGIAGMLFHLNSQFFHDQTLKNLVYTAPFAAPLAYSGLGLLLILDRMVDPKSAEWGRWVLLLALGGFVGNFVLSLADHAQNGFFYAAEWIPVIASAAAIGSLLATLLVYDDALLRMLTSGIMAAQAVVGIGGFVFHLRSVLAAPMRTLWEQVLFGAPLFAPFLFADLAALAWVALRALALSRSEPVACAAPSPAAIGGS